MKKNFNKFLIFIISIFTFIPLNVFAEDYGSDFVNFTVETVQTITGDGNFVSNVKDFADYDSRLSLLDGFENSFPICDQDSYANKSGIISETPGSESLRICYKGTIPNIKNLIEYFPYVTRFEYKLKQSDKIYYVFKFSSELPYIENNLFYTSGWSGGSFTISLLPKEGYFTTLTGEVVAFSAQNSAGIYNTNTTDYIKLYSSYASNYINTSWNFYYYNSSSYFDITVRTNYDLKEKSTDNIIVNATTGHVFGTDLDLVVPKDYYIDLIPKGSGDFSSYIYTNNFFYFDYSIYDKFNKTYSTISHGALDEMSVWATGGFNWLYWNIEFTELDLSLNPIISVFNPNDIDLTLKIKSEDFYYRIRSKDSTEYCIDDICYSNRYDNLYNYAHSFEYKADYDVTDYNNGLSFIKSIPDMVTSFISSFAFIGTLFTTIFTVFTGDILNYFYIIFGIMIIMLIIRVLK